MRIVDLFNRSARAAPDRPCLSDDRLVLSYAEVAVRSRRGAAALRARGVARGDRVGILAPNSIDAFVGLLSVLQAGIVWVPANGRATPDELAYFLRLTRCDLLLVHAEMRDLGQAAGDQASVPTMDLGDLFDPADQDLGGDGTEQEFDWRPDDTCSVFSTGGTTGSPKAAVWTHRTWQTLTVNLLHGVSHEGPPVHLVAAPLTHAAGVVALALIAVGATTILIPRAEPELILRAIEQHKVTTLFLPPTVIYGLLAHPAVRTFQYGSLQNLIYAAAPMSVDKLRTAIEVFGPVMVQTYGQAEAPMVCTILTREDHVEALQSGRESRLASCGRPALLTSVGIMDEAGQLQGPGSIGEIVIRGDLVMAGYLDNPEATSASRRCGWHCTGDIGWQDAEGYVYITDRKRDMIITGGFNVFPSEVEQVLWGHPAVQDCAVVGTPDAKWGEAVTAVVELKPGADISPSALMELCRTKLGGVKAPKQVLIWTELPRSAVGKVLKRVIRDHFWQGQDRKI